MTDDDLTFTGSDGMSADDYIEAVRRSAIKENKLGNDNWMVMYASKGLKGNARRWWATLDPTYRLKWDWFETAFLYRWPPIFNGIDGKECEAFISGAEQRILDYGKEGDDKWIAREIPKSFAGAALRWFATIDEQKKADWNLLKQAMFARWPASDQSDPAPRNSSISAAPGATPSSAAAEATENSKPLVLQGMIRVEAVDGQKLGYISRRLNQHGLVCFTKDPLESLQVKFEGTTSPFELRAENPASGFSMLGIQWSVSSPSLAPGSWHVARFVGLSRGLKSSLVATFGGQGESSANVWVIDSLDTITIRWVDPNQVPWILEPIEQSTVLSACPPGQTRYNPPIYNKVSLHLERND